MCVGASASENFMPPTSVYATNDFHQNFLRGEPIGSRGQGIILVRSKKNNFWHVPNILKSMQCWRKILKFYSYFEIINSSVISVNGLMQRKWHLLATDLCRLRHLNVCAYGPSKRFANSGKYWWMTSNEGAWTTIYTFLEIMAVALPYAANHKKKHLFNVCCCWNVAMKSGCIPWLPLRRDWKSSHRFSSELPIMP
jgi:hypothetical protein